MVNIMTCICAIYVLFWVYVITTEIQVCGIKHTYGLLVKDGPEKVLYLALGFLISQGILL